MPFLSSAPAPTKNPGSASVLSLLVCGLVYVKALQFIVPEVARHFESRTKYKLKADDRFRVYNVEPAVNFTSGRCKKSEVT